MDDARQWLSIALTFIMALATFIYTLTRNSRGDRDRKLDDVEERMTALENAFRADSEAGNKQRAELRERMVQIEERLRHMPDRETVYRIELGVTKLQSNADVQNQTLISQSNRLEKLLLTLGQKP